ncbi:MAG: hypothetical protein LC804_11255 [Acidobacteria bacterium]|nr:hypothetical protein [Acidobacteriota bacterium]
MSELTHALTPQPGAFPLTPTTPAHATGPAGPHARPALASGVRLRGAMHADGFAEQQWLVERDGTFIQLTELLYRIADQIDGRRSIAEIAAAVTASCDWAVEPQHVEHLLVHKLEPLGLISKSDTSRVGPTPASVHSPLALTMRMKMLSPRAIAPLTAIFKHCFAPALLIPLCVLVATSHWWLYAVYGVQNSIERAFYVPGGMLAILGLAVVAGLFHELGHASALRYGGGEPRGIGVGLYLVYPAFYSDVTDSYRLPRGARIRTDLGGIYFHFLFALALIAAALLTRSEFLFAAVLLFNVEAVRQLLPLVRLDGYWLLADITGISDFYSMLGALRRGRSGDRKAANVPALKPWAKKVVALYVLVTTPILLWLFVAMMLYLPELVRLTGNALSIHWQVISGDAPLVTKLLSMTQMLLLPLPLLATTYFITRTMVLPLFRYVERRAPRPIPQLAAASALAAVLAVAVATWTSASGGFTPDGAATARDPIAIAQTAKSSLQRVKTLQARVNGAVGAESFTGTIVLERPNRARVDVSGSESIGRFSVISDGNTVYVYFPDSNQYTATKAAPQGQNITAFFVDVVRTFFRPEQLTATAAGEGMALGGTERIGEAATEADVVEVTSRKASTVTWTYFLEKPTGILRRTELTVVGQQRERSSRWNQLEDVRIDEAVDSRTFQWVIPSGARPLDLSDLGVELPIPRAPQKRQ